jgi:hypothetical protein
VAGVPVGVIRAAWGLALLGACFPLHEMTFSRLPYIVISANDLDWSIDEDYDDET